MREHAKTHYHKGRPMNCKNNLMTLGKEGKLIMLLHCNCRNNTEEVEHPAPDLLRESVQQEQFHGST